MDRILTEEDKLGLHKFGFLPEAENPRSKVLSVETRFIRNVEKNGFITSQSLILSSYDYLSKIDLFDVKITPERLRKFADELELANKKAAEEFANLK